MELPKNCKQTLIDFNFWKETRIYHLTFDWQRRAISRTIILTQYLIVDISLLTCKVKHDWKVSP
jgi:hypothetical protein